MSKSHRRRRRDETLNFRDHSSLLWKEKWKQDMFGIFEDNSVVPDTDSQQRRRRDDMRRSSRVASAVYVKWTYRSHCSTFLQTIADSVRTA